MLTDLKAVFFFQNVREIRIVRAILTTNEGNLSDTAKELLEALSVKRFRRDAVKHVGKDLETLKFRMESGIKPSGLFIYIYTCFKKFSIHSNKYVLIM